MKSPAGLGLIIGLLTLSIPVQAQVLSQQAANCALNLAVFRIFQVTGVPLVPSEEEFTSWRNYLIASRWRA